MKFGQLIEYNRNIFVEKSYTNFGGETIPRSSSKKSKLSISLDQYYKVLSSLFLLHENHLLLSNIKLFVYIYINKKRSGTTFPLPHFLHDF